MPTKINVPDGLISTEFRRSANGGTKSVEKWCLIIQNQKLSLNFSGLS